MGNKPSPYVLRALCILGPEEILKLAHVLNREEVSFKKASGDDVVVWKQERAQVPKKKESAVSSEARVLPFSRPAPAVTPEPKEEASSETPEESQILSAEVVLLQREIARESGSGGQKAAASLGYQKATEMYVVKTHSLDGKEKMRFAATNGVLVNKKQA